MSITFAFAGYEANVEKPALPDGNRAPTITRNGIFSGRAIIARTGPDYRPVGWVLLRSHAKTPTGDELQEKQEPDLTDWLVKNHNGQILNLLGIPSERERAA